MKTINWKNRLTNKATLVALITGVISLVYQILGWFNIVSPISSNDLTNTIGVIVNMLVLLGVVVDPNTSGITDTKNDEEQGVEK